MTEVFKLPNFFAFFERLALVVDAHCEKEVPWTIDHAINNIPKIKGIDLLALAMMPFSPVPMVSSRKIKQAEISGNKVIRKGDKYRTKDEVPFTNFWSLKVIQPLTLLLLASIAVIMYDAERLVNAMAEKTVNESILAVM